MSISCTNRDGEIIDLINSVKKQNDDLKAQITALKKTTDSAMVAITKVTVSQAVTDKKLDAIQTELKSVLAQISSLTTQMTAANADLASIKAKLDALQVKCAELVAQIATLTTTLNSTLVDLKKQVAKLKNTSDSALIVITKLSAAQASSDKNIVSLQAELKNVVSQLADLSSQLGASNVDITSLKSKIDALQIKVNELIAEITLLNSGGNLKNGLVAYYPFNGNANDVSGNSNNGKVNGAKLASDRNGVANSSYSFNVNNWSWGSGGDNIYIPYNPSFNFSEFSISTWVKRTSAGSTISPQTLTIINRFQFGYTKPSGETWILQIDHGTSPTGALLSGTVLEQALSPAPNFYSKSNQIVPLNQWCNILMTYSQKTINLYINSRLVGTASNRNITLNTNGTSGITIGLSNQANGQWSPFDGSIDDVGIWNRALTPEEIKYLYENDFRP